MYNESAPNERREWKFTYKGEELLPFAQRRFAQHQAKESEMRENLSRMIKDPASLHDDARLQQLKRDVDAHAAFREQFEVYCHEFARAPKQQFVLRLGDVVFFGIHVGGDLEPSRAIPTGGRADPAAIAERPRD
jgi:hypothetical protein